MLNKKGFGLVEAVIASGIIVVVTASSIGLSTLIVKKTAEFDRQIVANNWAAEAIEVGHYLRNVGLKYGPIQWDSGLKHRYNFGAGLINTSAPLDCPVPSTDFYVNPSAINTNTEFCKVYPQRTSADFDFPRGLSGDVVAGFNDGSSNPDVLTVNNQTFYRKVFISNDPGNDIYTIRSVVYSVAGGEYTIHADIESKISNWKEAL